MKTGFICASGFNLVASATRGNKRLIAVVLGAPSSSMRALRAAQLLERGFNNNRLAWLKPSLGTIDALAPIDAAPPNLRDEMCGPKRKRPAAEDEDDDVAVNVGSNDAGVSMFTSGLQPQTMKISEMLAAPANPVTPVIVYTGPTRTGDAVLAADAAETAKQSIPKRKGAKAKLAAKQDAGADKKPEAKQEAKSTAKPDSKPVVSAKPAVAHAKPAASTAPAAKPVAATAAVAPAKPDKKAETAAKPLAAKPAATAAKPAAKDAKSGNKPAATQQKSETAPRS
jgi:D-alanyl-D-alanine carboxypeptidase